MNTIANRRRVYGGGEETIEVEYPTTVRIDCITAEDNVNVTIGYIVGASNNAVITLDGESVTSVANGAIYSVLVPTAGSHVITVEPKASWGSSWGLRPAAYSERIQFPYNMSSMVLCDIRASSNNNNNKWKTIDIVDSAYIPQVKTNANNVFSNADIIHVPIGSKQLYVENGVSQTILDKMVEVKFKYTL